MQEQEIWKDIEGYEGHYQVSNMGRVKSFKGLNPRILKAGKSGRKGNQYLAVVLLINKNRTSFHIHRLVAKHFCNGYKIGLQVDHIDGDKMNNKAINLRWVTNLQNSESYRSNPSIHGVGVEKISSGKFRSKTFFKGKQKHLGTYDTPEQAQQARTDFKTKHNIK